MVFYSIGSASGAVGAASLHAVASWSAVCAPGAAFSCLGLVLWAFTRAVVTWLNGVGPVVATGLL